MKRMQVNSSLTLLCTITAAVVTLTACYPAITTDMIRIMARTAVGRIKKIKDEHFQMSPEIDFGPNTDTPIEGLTSVLTHLDYLQTRLQVPPATHLRQLQTDLETLLGNLERMAVSQGCPLPKPGSNVHKDDTAFPITSNYLYLLELQRYLEKLCLNLDKLKTC
ncbi:leptin b [Astyanax mexicanus]|uniref:Leptin n=2 Tax=Astyanax mexicanus TaxID=7994 RepID=A0A8B9K7B6_ASTMX|nr:leptin b [Astyanax mexicanus]KAG9280637.1 leptin-B-like [Astyanax mexicanus]